MVQISLMARATEEFSDEQTRWFSSDGCVVYHQEHTEVFVGGTLVGSFGRREVVVRNLLLVNLAKERGIKKNKLAWSFNLSVEQVRLVRRRVEADGVEALFNRPSRGRKPKLTGELYRWIYSEFDAGKQVGDVHATLSRRKKKWGEISERSIFRVRKDWLAAQEQEPAFEDQAAEDDAQQIEMTGVVPPPTAPSVSQDMAQSVGLVAAGAIPSNDSEEDNGTEVLEATPLHGGQNIQHAGGWLLLSMVHALGLHAAVDQGWDAVGRWRDRLRVALDAVVLALGHGHGARHGVGDAIEAGTASLVG